MSQIKVRVSLTPVTHTLDKGDYQDAWDEHCEEEEGDLEADSFGEPSDEFVVNEFITALGSGNIDVAEIFESSAIGVERVDE